MQKLLRGKEISTSELNEQQRTLYYIAENMKMDKSISEEGYKHFQMAIKALKVDKDVCQNNGNKVPNTQELLKMASEDKPIDRSEIGIDTPKTSDGLQSYNDGFDFLQRRR